MRRCTLTCFCSTVLVLVAAPLAAQEHDEHDGPPLPGAFDEPIALHHDGKGLGPLSRPITTDSRQAQLYFDQGLQLVYSFGLQDAQRSFRESWKHDPDCAMCYFGEAWSWGSYLNGPLTAANAPRAYAAIQRARELADGNTTPAERAMIEAMTVRYEPTHDPDRRRELDERWAEAINEVWERYPEDLDIGFLAAESLMLLQPRRGYWDVENPEVQRIHRQLETLLAIDPTHPGNCHLYVHATEPTQRPGKAEICADYLGPSIPGASHIQHMPSHTYNRVGRWNDAVRANTLAWHSDLKAEHGEGFAIYPSHNLHMLLFAASNAGQGAVAIQAARDYAEVQRGGEFYEVLTLLRFGRFEEILELEDAPEDPIFKGLWDFGVGYAHLRSGNRPLARAHLEMVREVIADDPEAQFRGHPAEDLLGVVAGILEAEIMHADGLTREAIAVLEHAVELEDGLRYDEPEPLNFSARDWLGAVLLEDGRAAEAEAVYRAALEDHPHNGWSLIGLEQALRAQGRGGEADQVQAELEEAWPLADHWVRASRF